jgi:hypothetical protein
MREVLKKRSPGSGLVKRRAVQQPAVARDPAVAWEGNRADPGLDGPAGGATKPLIGMFRFGSPPGITA